MSKILLSYIPHGINPTKFYRIQENTPEFERIKAVRTQVFNKDADDVDFVILYNNRNVRRKMTGNVIYAYKTFINKLTKEQANKCRLVLHTAPVDDAGTDLIRLTKDLAPEVKVVFSAQKIDAATLNCLYNIADVTINLANAEGFGLATAESLMAETPILVAVTGGLQDQCGFRDEAGQLVGLDHFNKEWGSNADGKYKIYGEWAFPVFPATRTLVGSPATPYIFEDNTRWEDAADRLLEIYNMSKEERHRRGKLGREFMMGEANMTSEYMCNKLINDIELTFNTFKPQPRYTLLKV